MYHGEEGHQGSSDVDPRELLRDDALFFIGLLLGHASFVWCNAEDGSDEATLWLLANDGQSWATIEYVPGRQVYETDEYGRRNLWGDVEAAYRRWQSLGCPERSRFGLTVDSAGQHVWLDEPTKVIDRP